MNGYPHKGIKNVKESLAQINDDNVSYTEDNSDATSPRVSDQRKAIQHPRLEDGSPGHSRRYHSPSHLHLLG